MAVNVYLGTTSDDPRTLTKTVTYSETALPCKPTEPCNILNPTLLVAYTDTTIFGKNYSKIPDWGNRKYFINDIQVLTGGKVMLALAIDYLGTYDTSIRACPCCITRSEDAGINWVPDNKFPFNSLNTTTKGEAGLFKTPFGKNPSSPWILSTINDNGAVHTTPTPPNNNE